MHLLFSLVNSFFKFCPCEYIWVWFSLFKCCVVVHNLKRPHLFLPLFFCCIQCKSPCLLNADGVHAGVVLRGLWAVGCEPCGFTRYRPIIPAVILAACPLTLKHEQISHKRWPTNVQCAPSHHKAAVVSGPAALLPQSVPYLPNDLYSEWSVFNYFNLHVFGN